MINRRTAIKLTASLGTAAISPHLLSTASPAQAEFPKFSLTSDPILDRSLFPEPIIIESVELLKNGENFIIRVRAKDGVEGLAIGHNTHLKVLYPILTQKIAPYFPGKDTRDLETLIDGVYRSSSNYKFQGLPFWVPLASIEFAILDLLGKVAKKPVGALFGKIYQSEIAVYQANNHRGKTAEESVELIQKSVESSQAKAVKYKVGGRMSRNADDPPGRTEKLIPLVRKVLGDDITIYADSNGSYDPENAIRVGKMLEETNVSFFEEPCPFDHYSETKQIGRAHV